MLVGTMGIGSVLRPRSSGGEGDEQKLRSQFGRSLDCLRLQAHTSRLRERHSSPVASQVGGIVSVSEALKIKKDVSRHC